MIKLHGTDGRPYYVAAEAVSSLTPCSAEETTMITIGWAEYKARETPEEVRQIVEAELYGGIPTDLKRVTAERDALWKERTGRREALRRMTADRDAFQATLRTTCAERDRYKSTAKHAERQLTIKQEECVGLKSNLLWMTDDRDILKSAAKHAENRARIFTSRILSLRNKLNRHGRHLDSCAINNATPGGGPRCDCGLWDAKQ